ncbi:hypothetical protein DMB44_08530 [Thermoplasma sp. Kam2015]|uniref:hypothetical protein n=1 Tax=Thermoplasma sp. Kam2015 TaxID=2094122 RepID=UPI000D97F949|nr:hypothetical protein [Thermoplasma sp. Kam2015]PYB67569.1 hypothetical protein DMB44_08530 [Thermoplasma sp. Kam2015]
MVKTTINLDEDIYEEIVKESIEKYGSTKNISKIINQRLKNSINPTEKRKGRITFKVSENLSSLDADSEIRAGWDGNNK